MNDTATNESRPVMTTKKKQRRNRQICRFTLKLWSLEQFILACFKERRKENRMKAWIAFCERDTNLE